MSHEGNGNFIRILLGSCLGMIAFSMGIWALANEVPREILDQSVRTEPQQPSERIAKVGAVHTQTPAAPPSTAVEPVTETEADPAASQATNEEAAAVAAVDGKSIYDQACFACHTAGVAGAPRLGDAGAWVPRIEQGTETLYRHSIEGFQGATGVMPPKGGRMDLDDASIRAAVDYMIAEASE